MHSNIQQSLCVSSYYCSRYNLCEELCSCQGVYVCFKKKLHTKMKSLTLKYSSHQNGPAQQHRTPGIGQSGQILSMQFTPPLTIITAKFGCLKNAALSVASWGKMTSLN